MSPAAGPARVVVVGAVNVDLVVLAERLPARGETVVGADLARHGGGKGANAAVAAARAGAAVELIGAVGRDDDGVAALDELRRDGVGVEHVAAVADRHTGVALIVVDPAGDNQIAVAVGANAAVSVAQVEAALDACLPLTGCVLVSTEIPADAAIAAVRAARTAGVACVLNPAPVVPGLAAALRAGPVLTPNRGELAALVGGLGVDDGSAPVEAQARLLAEHTGAPVVVTLGGQGALLARPGGTTRRWPAPEVEVRDTTGAGDTFNGALAARLAAGVELDHAVRSAVAAASRSVSAVGARSGMPTSGEPAM